MKTGPEFGVAKTALPENVASVDYRESPRTQVYIYGTVHTTEVFML